MTGPARCLLPACLALSACIAALAQSAPTRAATTAPATASAPASRPRVPVAIAAAEAQRWIARPEKSERIADFDPAARIEHRTYAAPKALQVWIAAIDLTADGVSLTQTPPSAFDGENVKFETACATTLQFAEAAGVQLAFNASAFAPFRAKPGEPMDVTGLAADDGRVWSPATEKSYGAMFVSRKGRVSLKGPPLSSDGIWDALPGFRMLLDDGRIAVTDAESNTSFGGVNPRTAVGVDRDGKMLWVVVVDGRQPGVSEGITLVELACLFESLHAYDALNFDGGGSSTLVMQAADGTHKLLNTPVGMKLPGTLRQVASNVGVRLPRSAAPGGQNVRPNQEQSPK